MHMPASVPVSRENHPFFGVLLFLAVLWLLPLAVLFSPLLLGYWVRRQVRRRALLRRIRAEWIPQGKYGVFFYSEARVWKAYFEETFLPKCAGRVFARNWSRRAAQGWDEQNIEAQLLRLFWRRGPFYPGALLITPEGRVETFAFHDAYLNSIKLGKEEYKRLEQAFFARLEEIHRQFKGEELRLL